MGPIFICQHHRSSDLTALITLVFFVLLTVTLSARHLGYDPRALLSGGSGGFRQQCLGEQDQRKGFERYVNLNESTKNIFFLETAGASCINERAACSIESAALRHPYYTVWLLTILDMRDCRPLRNLQQLPNFRLLNINLNSMVKDSVLVHWYLKDDWNHSPFRVNHLSDALRLLVLWKYGGVYADMDVLTLKSFSELRNVVARELFPDVGNSVMVFDKGHPFLSRCLQEFSSTYKARKWAHNGPRLLERVLSWFCPRNLLGKVPLVPDSKAMKLAGPPWNTTCLVRTQNRA
ncbi:lactosylceramide 4-alpha-galactosyltransferase [Rhipicephalus sanguineus]|uniref:lactosylceramide 4-alpha-galactosyltransferase n=1 Tax=Rhipicephalus sanguineus TaxID=34632 RepID=UPI0020C220DB|nr:lactosylceramide 4-alpha-galactosyltransferase [Rhipicephalus sanguineus]